MAETSRWSARALAVVLVVGVLSLASRAGASDSERRAEPDWLRHLNELRIASGVQPVADVPAWAGGIAAHLRYLHRTPGRLVTGRFASRHTENPKSPWYSEAGARAGGRSNLLYDARNPVDAIDDLMAAPFHAIAMLRPELRRVGFSYDPATSFAGLDVIGGLSPRRARPEPILFPGHGAVTGLSRFAGENPDPIETCRHQHPGVDWSNAALPLIAMLPQRPVSGLVASLTGPNGTAWSSDPNLCVITAATYVSSDRVAGPTGRSILEGDNAVIVIARRPLQEGRFTATLRQPGFDPVTWSFTHSAEQGVYATRRASVSRSVERTVRVVVDGEHVRIAGTVRRQVSALIGGLRVVGVGAAPLRVIEVVRSSATATRSATVRREVTVTCRGARLAAVVECARDRAQRAATELATRAAGVRADRLARQAAMALARPRALEAAQSASRRAPTAAERQAAVLKALDLARADLVREVSVRQLSASRGSTR
ncbi:MAG: hypothetical protein WB767_06865 [Nocardioides sp.]